MHVHSCESTYSGEIEVRLSILVITILVAVLQWAYLIQVAREITTILGISVFFTKQTLERRKLRTEVSNSDSSLIRVREADEPGNLGT